jgi:pyruvate formate lyase activating enzyme
VQACSLQAIALVEGRAVTDRSRCIGCGRCVAVCPEGARALLGSLRSVDELMEEVERDALFYEQSGGGVTLSGGEPLAQAPFAAELLLRCRERRIHTAVDTCGYADKADLAWVAAQTDLFLFDIKLLDDRRHICLTGASNRPILDNLARLSEWGKRVWLRYPLIPGANDAESDLDALGAFAGRFANVESIQVLPYHGAGERKRLRLERGDSLREFLPPSEQDAERVVERLRRVTKIPVRVGG